MSSWTLVSSSLKELVPYEPGKPIDDVAREMGLAPESIIKLASNENPLGPSPLAVAAIQKALATSHIYPDGGTFHLSTALAKKTGVEKNRVVLGNGSNEILELIYHAFTRPGTGNVVASQYAFVVYKLQAQLFDVKMIEVPSKSFGHDLDAMHAAITPETRVVFITNPNNPTGTRLSNDALYNFIKSVPESLIIALDEAYYEFMTDAPPSIEWTMKHPNLIVLRTFSKIQGLAGLRIGYAITHPDTANILQRCRQPFNVNALAQAGALASLEDDNHPARTVKMTHEGMKNLITLCKKLKLDYVPSEANFLMIRVGDGDQIFKQLMQQGIIIRALKPYQLPEWIRVTIGTPEQMNRFSTALEQLLSQPS